jgi:type IV secretion system protein VirD4
MQVEGIKHVLSGSDFTWSDLKEEKTTIYVVMPPDEAKTYYRFTRLMFASAFKAMLAPPRAEHGVWLIMDELATSLGDRSLDQIESMMSMARGYGVKLMGVFQSYPQAEHLFGKDKAQALMASAGIQQFYTVNDEHTAGVICRRAGARTELELQGGYDQRRPIPTAAGAQPQPMWEPGNRAIGVPLYRPQDLYSLPRNKTIIFKEGVGQPIEAFRTPYFKMSQMAALAAPNPYAPPAAPAPQRAPSAPRKRRFWSGLIDRSMRSEGIAGPRTV